jgi:hypothetical protein
MSLARLGRQRVEAGSNRNIRLKTTARGPATRLPRVSNNDGITGPTVRARRRVGRTAGFYG